HCRVRPRAARSGGFLRELSQDPRLLASDCEAFRPCRVPPLYEKSLVVSGFARHWPMLARLTSEVVSGTIAHTPGGSESPHEESAQTRLPRRKRTRDQDGAGLGRLLRPHRADPECPPHPK